MKKLSGVRCQVSARSIRGRILNILKADSWQLNADSRGFTLLLAALVASITLALGASIYSMAQKEVRLSSIGRDSQYAFYAADTAAECALYWDMRFNYFGTSTPTNVIAPEPRCDAEPLNVTGDRPVGSYQEYTMSFQFEPSDYCARVSVIKTLTPITGTVQTTIRADGFSTRCEVIATSPRALQRSVELHY